MSPQEMDALVARIGDEILARLDRPGGSRSAAESRWSSGVRPLAGPAHWTRRWTRPSGGYASVLDVMALGSAVTAGSLESGCERAAQLGVRAVWTASSWTPLAYRSLRGSGVRIGAAVSFPFGDATASAKCAEAESALLAGAQELLTTLNAGAWLSGEKDRAYADLIAVCELARSASAPVTVAIDSGLLDDAELLRAAIAARLAGATALQCSSGWALGGLPETRKIELLAEAVGAELLVGAAGGMDLFADAALCAAAGARRLGVADPASVLRGAPRG